MGQNNIKNIFILFNITMDKITMDKITIEGQIIQYPNGTWYYTNKNNRRLFYSKKNKQLWNKETRKYWYNNLTKTTDIAL
jgi:hypothetical protein